MVTVFKIMSYMWLTVISNSTKRSETIILNVWRDFGRTGVKSFFFFFVFLIILCIDLRRFSCFIPNYLLYRNCPFANVVADSSHFGFFFVILLQKSIRLSLYFRPFFAEYFTSLLRVFCRDITIIFVCSSFSHQNNGTQISVFSLRRETTERLRLSSFFGKTKSQWEYFSFATKGRNTKNFVITRRKDDIKQCG